MRKVERIARACMECGEEFWVLESKTKRGRGKYCSNHCKSKVGGRAASANQYGESNPNWKGDAALSKVEAKKLYRERYPEAAAAHDAVRQAVRAGRLVRGPCERCGFEGKTHGHHDDYSKPLEVRWLCPPCHRIEHGASC